MLAALLIVFFYSDTYAQNGSVLASGAWYKFSLTQKGIYQITGKYLKEQGIDLAQVDPEQIQLFGYGGGMLPQALDQPRRNDLPENAIYVSAGSDGKFDEKDFILFYGDSPDQTVYRFIDNAYQLTHQKNLYSDTVFYFLTFNQQKGKRISPGENISSPSTVLTTFDDHVVHEQDLTNILAGSGREWYGEVFNSGESLSLDFDTPGLSENSEIRLKIDVLGKATSSSAFEVFLNDQRQGEISPEPLLSGTYNEKGRPVSASFVSSTKEVNAGGGKVTVKMKYQTGGGRGSAHLDRVLMSFSRQLQLYSNQTFFRSIQSVQYPVAAFRIKTATGQVKLWDITDPQNPGEQKFNFSNGHVEYGIHTGGELKEFVIFNHEGFLKPAWHGLVANQNLKEGTVPEMVIVSHPAFLPEAKRLAGFRQQQKGITVRVVTPQQIYNEFSSGAQDITAIRNYLKYLYDREEGRLQYLLLFGKCSYDYKNRTDRNTNFVPTYESRNSTHPIYSYSSDDYFGFLEDDEGYWNENYAGDHTLDIGIGRLPIKKLEEARIVVDKLMHYDHNPQTFGDWRNQVVFVADDGDGDKHQRDADRLATQVDTTYFDFNSSKIYTDAYPQESMPGGERAPKVNDAIGDAIKKGALIINYTGHGNERQWASEHILNKDMINHWKNLDKLPFFVTATCEFGRHDDPMIISGAEQLVLNPHGGAVGMVTTARPVFANSNFILNQAFYQQVFRQVEGEYQALGHIFKHTKNSGLGGRVNRNFSLLGDPSMTLAYPKGKVVIDSLLALNAAGGFTPTDTLKALSHIRLKGRVVERDGLATNQNFTGTLQVSVFDKPVQVTTRGNEGTVMQFEERKSVIHRGRASVTNGFFELEFVIPKNINYKAGGGKISTYAVEQGEHLSDANGADIDIQIGGTSKVVKEDVLPPVIALFMDDTTFISGGVTAANTSLVAYIQDESGINVSSNGLGQHITATLQKAGQHEEEVRAFILNDFFTTEIDSYQQGVLRYPLENLEDGKYVLTLQAWDNWNNKSESSITFFVRSQGQFVINSFVNYPNPFSDQTIFTIDHNRQGDSLKAVISIFNVQGKLVYSFERTYQHASNRINDLQWDGMDANGNRLNPGVYLARLILQSQTDGAESKKNQKIIIIN